MGWALCLPALRCYLSLSCLTIRPAPDAARPPPEGTACWEALVPKMRVSEDTSQHNVHEAENDPELKPLPFDGFFAHIAALNDVGPTSAEKTDQQRHDRRCEEEKQCLLPQRACVCHTSPSGSLRQDNRPRLQRRLRRRR
jgi:hypothetical protein